MSPDSALVRPFFFLLALASLLPAGEAASYTPESAAAFARQHNPDLIAARAELAEARARVQHAGGRSHPEIEAEAKPNLAGREFSVGIGITQKFPLTRRLQIEKGLSVTALALAGQEIEAAERQLTHEVKSLAVKLLSLKAKQDLNLRQSTARRDLAAALKKASAAGEAPPLEAAQLELENSQLSLLNLQTGSESTAVSGSLRALLGGPPGESITITGSLAAPARPPSSSPVAGHPSYQAALTKAEAARQNIDLVRANNWDDLTVGLGYERTHNDDAGAGMERDNAVVLRFSFPLPIKKQSAAHLAEAAATAERANLEAQAVSTRLQAETGSARQEMLAHAALHDEATRLLTPALELEKRFTALQKTGETTLTEVLRARQQRFALESAALEAVRDFHLARLRLENASSR